MHRLSGRKVESTLLSYSRQRLPRPARFNSASFNIRRAQVALATAPPPVMEQMPINVSGEQKARSIDAMDEWLQGQTRYTVIDTPLPADMAGTTKKDSFFFPNSPAQESLAVVEACLFDGYDVPRAKIVFDQLREGGGVEIPIRVFNQVLSGYLGQASRTNDLNDRQLWLRRICTLFDEIVSGKAGVKPTPPTFAIASAAWHRFNPDSPNFVQGVHLRTPTDILNKVVEHGHKLAHVLADKVFNTSEEAEAVLGVMSRAAVDLGHSELVIELGRIEELGRQEVDPLLGVPEVMPVESKKLQQDKSGEVKEMRKIPFNLDILRRHLSKVRLARRLLSEDAFARQKLLEESVFDVAVERLSRFNQQMEELGLDNNALRRRELQAWMWEWHKQLQVTLKEAIQDVQDIERQAELDGGKKKRPLILAPFLSLLSVEKLSLITILELMRLQGTGGVLGGMKTARALVHIGKAVEIEHKAEICRKHNISLPATAMRPGDTSYFTNLSYNDLHMRRLAAMQYMEDGEEWTADWTQALRVRVGSFLIDKLIEVATVLRTATNKNGETVSEEHPAFFHTYEYMRGHKLGVLRLNPVVAERIARDGMNETLHPRHLPMLVKPRPWTNYDQGGYLHMKSFAMRVKESQEQLTYLRHAANLGNVELVFAGLDVLGSTPWQINRQIFDVVLEVWNSGQRLGKLPPSEYEVPEPEKPDNYHIDPVVKNHYLQQHQSWIHSKGNNHSDRCNVNYKIEIARSFIGDTFYLPHNLDFRGRAYPIPPHLSHIGDDLSRGLLKFAESKPLGERGLRWLKIHLANLYGFDKGSFDERESFVMQRLENVYDSATNPLNGKGWWKTADDPWQCLACCMELHAALESEDPLKFESNLPVHQDGTCNGLQHYAALGGDGAGARQVNLDVTDRPSDVYTHVAEMVEGILEKDAAQGNPLAVTLKGKVSRKVVKQTVMTTVYGVTFVGAREQIHKQLKDRGDLPIEDCWELSSYLAKNVLGCIGTLFHGANDIQRWLNMCARIITKGIPSERIAEVMASSAKGGGWKSRLAKEQMTSVVWTTPLGLPIVQPYRKLMRKQIVTSLQTVYISDPNIASTVNPTKQASAFPPNFIHSLDATHMMLTALEMRTHGLTFASVHDSYWTHAASIDEMSAVIRDSFIALHSRDLLTRLRDEFMTRYQNHKIAVSSIMSNRSMAVNGLQALTSNILAEKRAKASASGDSSTASELLTKVAPAAEVEGEEGLEARSAEELHDDGILGTLLQQRVIETLKVQVVSGGRKRKSAKSSSEESSAESEEKSANVKSGTQQPLSQALEDALEYRFINVVDLLPPVPAKGDFDVQKIKKSQYFFS